MLLYYGNFINVRYLYIYASLLIPNYHGRTISIMQTKQVSKGIGILSKLRKVFPKKCIKNSFYQSHSSSFVLLFTLVWDFERVLRSAFVPPIRQRYIQGTPLPRIATQVIYSLVCYDYSLLYTPYVYMYCLCRLQGLIFILVKPTRVFSSLNTLRHFILLWYSV